MLPGMLQRTSPLLQQACTCTAGRRNACLQQEEDLFAGHVQGNGQCLARVLGLLQLLQEAGQDACVVAQVDRIGPEGRAVPADQVYRALQAVLGQGYLHAQGPISTSTLCRSPPYGSRGGPALCADSKSKCVYSKSCEQSGAQRQSPPSILVSGQCSSFSLPRLHLEVNKGGEVPALVKHARLLLDELTEVAKLERLVAGRAPGRLRACTQSCEPALSSGQTARGERELALEERPA